MIKTEILPNKNTETQHELEKLDKRIDEILKFLRTIEDKVGMHTSEVKAGELHISYVDLLLKRAIVLTETANRYWNVKPKISSINIYTRKNKEAYLLLQKANCLDPNNTEVLLNMAKVQDKLTPNNPIRMQRILGPLINILDMPRNDMEKFQLSQTNFLLAISSQPLDYELLQDARIMFEKLGRRDWVRQCDDFIQSGNDNYTNSKFWADKGWTLGLWKKYQEAIDCFDKAIKINPTEIKALRGKGSVLGRLERYQEAIDCFDKAIKINPTDHSFLISKGTALFFLEKYQEAIDCFDKAILVDSTNDTTLTSKGRCLSKLGKYQEAIDYFDNAIKINPTDGDIWNNKCECLYQLGKIEQAIKCYDDYISIDPDNSLIWHGKGLCLDRLGQTEKAKESFNKAKYLDPLI